MASFVIRDGKRVYRKYKVVRGKRIPYARWLYQIFHNIELPSDIDIHHKNGNPIDNRIENLEAISHTLHPKAHAGDSRYLPGKSISENGKIKKEYHQEWRRVNRDKCRESGRAYYNRKRNHV